MGERHWGGVLRGGGRHHAGALEVVVDELTKGHRAAVDQHGGPLPCLRIQLATAYVLGDDQVVVGPQQVSVGLHHLQCQPLHLVLGHSRVDTGVAKGAIQAVKVLAQFEHLSSESTLDVVHGVAPEHPPVERRDKGLALGHYFSIYVYHKLLVLAHV